MAGTVVVDTVKSSTSGAPVFQNTSGTQIGTLCRAWVLFNGTSPGSIRAAFNVSSITYSSSGNFLVNFTNSFSSANYAVAGAIGATGGANAVFFAGDATQTQTASQYQVVVRSYSASFVDATYISASFFQ